MNLLMRESLNEIHIESERGSVLESKERNVMYF